MAASLEFTSGTYSHVTFGDMKESYYLGQPIQFRFETTEPFNHKDKDFFGLYKVGWSSPAEHKAKIDVPLDKQLACFTGDGLELEDAEHYQICYVPETGRVCGTSEPFQYHKHPQDLSFMLEDSDNDMVIVDSMESLVSRITALENENQRLKQKLNDRSLAETNTQAVSVDFDNMVKDVNDISITCDMQEKSLFIKQIDGLSQEVDELQNLITTQKLERDAERNKLQQTIDELLRKTVEQDSQIKNLESENQLLRQQQKSLQEDLVTKIDAETLTSAVDTVSTGVSPEPTEGSVDVETIPEPGSAIYPDTIEQPPGGKASRIAEIAIDVGARLFRHLSQTMSDFSGDTPMESVFTSQSATPSDGQLTHCPACNETFKGLSTQQMMEHVEQHGGNMCPICYMQYNVDTPLEYFKQHVRFCAEEMSANQK